MNVANVANDADAVGVPGGNDGREPDQQLPCVVNEVGMGQMPDGFVVAEVHWF
jgi:hypothetical protein